MPGVLAKISSLRRDLPSAEGQVADYINRYPQKAGLQSISELARQSKVSVASVSRLSKKLGYNNYKRLRTDLAQDVFVENENIGSIFQAITSTDTDTDIIDKVFQGNIRSLEDTLKISRRRDMVKAAKRIAQTPRVVFFGIASSGHIAMDAALRFSLLDVQAESYSDAQQVFVQALRMRKSDVAIGLSHSGRSKITTSALEIARKSGATTIGISNYMKSPLQKHSDIFLCTSFSESRVKVAALSSRIAQMCIVDALYLLAAKYRKVFDKAEDVNDYVEKALRF